MTDGGRSGDMLCKYNTGLEGQTLWATRARFMPAGSNERCPYGAQTWDEMSVAFFSVVVDVNTNPILLFRDKNGHVALTEKVEEGCILK
jgi:hypothetical protein